MLQTIEQEALCCNARFEARRVNLLANEGVMAVVGKDGGGRKAPQVQLSLLFTPPFPFSPKPRSSIAGAGPESEIKAPGGLNISKLHY